jgi:hypothetical protein
MWGDLMDEAFLKYDYANTVDLGKSFLTLVSAILVFSVTFAEKIINWEKSDLLSKSLLGVCWLLLIISIIGCGVSLNFIFGSALAVTHPNVSWRVVVYGQIKDYLKTANFAWQIMGIAGCSFVLALILMLVVAIRKMQTARVEATPESDAADDASG